jgi:hypothetical protein
MLKVDLLFIKDGSKDGKRGSRCQCRQRAHKYQKQDKWAVISFADAVTESKKSKPLKKCETSTKRFYLAKKE